MGMWSDWHSKNAGKEKSLVSAEWVLKKIDEGSGENAPKNATLNDAAESSILPATASTPIVTLLQTIRNNLKYLINNKADKNSTYTKTEIINKIYPVGSIYMSINNTNPGTYLTGTTWAVWGSGRVPVGVDTGQTEFNTVEKTGGEKTHILTIGEMPKHTHKIPHKDNSDGGDINSWGYESNFDNNSSYQNTLTFAGSGSAHNNLQPYITCYMFKRTV
jgi:hypothetical protein